MAGICVLSFALAAYQTVDRRPPVEFSFDQFYQLNRRILIWVLFFGLLWLLRDFFGLIFLIFALSFVAAPLARFARERLRLPHFVSIILVYACFLLALASFVRFVTPRVGRQIDTLMRNLSQIETTLIEQKRKLVAAYPSLDSVLMGYLRSSIPEEDLRDVEMAAANRDPGAESWAATAASPGANANRWKEEITDEVLIRLYLKRQMEVLREHVPQFVKLLWAASGTMLLALLFSFLISLDAVRLRHSVNSLRLSRLRDFYAQTAQPIVRFGYVVGRAIQAQVAIACANTLFTILGCVFLKITSLLAVFSLLVFLCSFIPVLGVFISTTPIVLVALNSYGVGKAVGVIVMVAVIHFLEAYVLNPLIYGRHLKLNPALVLMVLYVGYHAFGVWGMLLGVPVTYYVLHDVLGVPLWDEAHLAPPDGTAGSDSPGIGGPGPGPSVHRVKPGRKSAISKP